MTVEEAIFLSEEVRNLTKMPLLPAHKAAIQLGIEALKERQEGILQGFQLWHEFLPGETKG